MNKKQRTIFKKTHQTLKEFVAALRIHIKELEAVGFVRTESEDEDDGGFLDAMDNLENEIVTNMAVMALG